MKVRQRIGTWVALGLLLTAAFARADCVPSLAPISSIGVFPNRMAAAVATNGSIVGVAKVGSDPTTNAIYFATFNSAPTPLTPDVTVAATSLSGPAALLWNGSEFGLFYQAPSLTLMLQRIDALGHLIGAPIAVLDHGWSPADEFDVVWVQARNLWAIGRTVTAGRDYGVWITLISHSGAVEIDSFVPLPLNPPALPHVAALADGTVGLALVRSGSLPSLTVAWLPPSGPPSTVVVSDQTVTDVRLASDGNSVLIIDAAPTSNGGTTLRYAQVGVAGVLTPDSPFLSGSGIDIAPRSLIWNATLSEWALVYVDAPLGFSVFPGDTRFRRFTSPAGMASDTLVSPDPTHSRLAAPFPPVFVNGAYIDSIARVLPPPQGTESYLVKLCPFFVTATADYSIQWPFAPITFTAHPSGGSPGYTYSWTFGDLAPSLTGSVVQHAYGLPGVYTVTVTGTDSTGAQSVYKFTVTVAFLRHRAVR